MSNLKHYSLTHVSCTQVQQLMCDGIHVLLDIWNVDQQALMHMNATLTGQSCSWVICCLHTCKIGQVLTTLMYRLVFPLMRNSNTTSCDMTWQNQDCDEQSEKQKKGETIKITDSKTTLNKKRKRKEVQLKVFKKGPKCSKISESNDWHEKCLHPLQKEHKIN